MTKNKATTTSERDETDLTEALLPAETPAVTDFADDPLPLPPGAGEPEPAAVQVSPYSLAVSYQIGNSRVEWQILDCPFEDIETVDQFTAVVSAISQANKGMRVTPLFMRMLRK